MAMLFDLDTERDNRFAGSSADGLAGGGDPVDQAFELIAGHVQDLQPQTALRRIRRYQAKLSAMESAVVAKLTTDTGNDRAAKRALDDGKTSRAATNKAAKRGEAAAKNADLIDKVAAGDLSEEQLDVIADTAAKTDGAAATDSDFIDKVAGVDPDQAQNIAKKFIADHADPEGTQTEHDRMRANRKAANYYAKKDGLHTIALGGDAVANKNMWDAIKKRADQLYEADGGRDLATGLHPRTYQQRLHDAAYELLCQVTSSPTGTTHQPRGGNKTSNGRPQIFVGLTLDKYLGLDPAALAEQIGLGLIPDTVLADYLEHADIIGALYDKNGQPLWLGRTKRHATLMQRYALIARDKACVRCGADHAGCQAHHLMPWNAPGKGQTNLDQLVLLCGPCHRKLHADNLTIYQDNTGTWRTRPATPNETPPQPIPYPQRE